MKSKYVFHLSLTYLLCNGFGPAGMIRFSSSSSLPSIFLLNLDDLPLNLLNVDISVITNSWWFLTRATLKLCFLFVVMKLPAAWLELEREKMIKTKIKIITMITTSRFIAYREENNNILKNWKETWISLSNLDYSFSFFFASLLSSTVNGSVEAFTTLIIAMIWLHNY